MTQVVSPHVGGTARIAAALVSCEGCQYMHPAQQRERLEEQQQLFLMNSK
jgi:hypothetical protein